MRVTYLELENIKSYSGPVRIDFTLGLNAVCGANGSGKTTVLEAIGYALFNFLPYNTAAFVREGQKSGTIRVGLMARDDREYQVVRRAGSQSTYYVCDAETGSRLAERQEAVADWIRRYALDMDRESELPALFKNAVGVPQGLMTADFLGSGATRKSIFDPLLRVEEYRDAFEYLLQTINYLKDRTGQLSESIARLEAETERIPQQEDRATELREQAHVTIERVEALEAELAAVEEQKGVLDRLQETIGRLETEGGRADADVRVLRERLEASEGQLESAEAARRAADESEEGYRLVETARAHLDELMTRAEARNQVRTEQAQAQGAYGGAYKEIERLDAERADCLAAAEAAAALVEMVTEQGRIDEELRGLEDRLRDKERVDREVGNLRAAMSVLETTIAGREQRIVAARAAGAEGERLAAVSAQLSDVLARVGELGARKEGLGALADEGRDLKQRHEDLTADSLRWEELQRQIEQTRPVAQKQDELLARQRALAEERTEKRATIEYRRLARERLEEAHCPLLELECPVVARDGSVLQRLDARGTERAAELEGIEAALRALEPEVETARAAASSLQQLELEAAGLKRSADELQRVSAELEACRERYRELQQRLAAEAELINERKELEAEVSRLQHAARLGAELSVLEEQDAKDGEALAVQSVALEEMQSDLETLEAVEEQVRAARQRLTALADPRSRQQELLMRAGRKAEVESRLDAAQSHLGEIAGRVKALSAALAPYDGLDEELEAERAVVERFRDAHARFLQVRDEAGQVEARRTIVTATRAELESAETRAASVRADLAGKRAEYDPERHLSLQRRCDRNRAELAAQREVLKHHEGDLQQVEKELARLRRQEERRRAEEQERERVGRVAEAVKFIRDTIKAAGPAVTETLLKSISQGANDIYAEIMDDHAIELRWDRDYEVIVQAGAEERKFVQLSGGEQMSAALAVRLALLKEMSEVDFAFFDEPTQNMDGERRSNLAEQIRQVRGFDQLIVISHDDTFEHHTDNLVLLRKDHDETVVER